MLFLGRISYAFYLLHGFALNGVEMVFPPETFADSLGSTSIALILAIAIAWVAHVVLERPANRLGHTLSARMDERRTRPAPSAWGG